MNIGIAIQKLKDTQQIPNSIELFADTNAANENEKTENYGGKTNIISGKWREIRTNDPKITASELENITKLIITEAKKYPAPQPTNPNIQHPRPPIA